LDDPFHGGKADAMAGKFVGAVQPLERAEQLARVAGLETRTVVADKERHQRRVRPGSITTEFDPRRIRVAGELPGIADEVLQQVADQRGITRRAKSGFDVDLDPSLRLGMFQLADGIAGDAAEIERVEPELLTADPRHPQ